MSTTVLDASATLAFVNGESGSDVVERALLAGAVSSTANWSEVAQKTLHRGVDWGQQSILLHGYGIGVEPVTIEDAEAAAALWRPGLGLSLADRLCIALGQRLDATVLTADRTWGSSGRIEQIR